MNFISSFLLAISCSIDAFGIGITYGLRKIKLSKKMTISLFIILFLVTIISCLIGNFFKFIFSGNIANFIGSAILIVIGFIIIFKEDYNSSITISNSSYINSQEALALALAISIDSFCVGIGVSAIGVNILIFSFLTALFHCTFLNCSLILGSVLTSFTRIPQNIWSELSGELLIFIGLFKLLF